MLPRSLATAAAARLRIEDPIEFALKRSRSVQEVLEVHQAHLQDFEGMHIASLWSRMEGTSDAHGPYLDTEAGHALVEHSVELIHRGALSSAHLSRVARGAVSAGRRDHALLDAIVANADVEDVGPRELSDFAWALATAAHTPHAFFDTLAASAARRVDEMDEEQLARFALAYASTGHPAPLLFDAIGIAAASRYTSEVGVVQGTLTKSPIEALPNLAWAFATVGRTTPQLFGAIAAAAAPRVREMQPPALARLAWAFAAARHTAPTLFEGLGRRAKARARAMSSDDVARTAWAFASAGHADRTTPALFSALADAMWIRRSECTVHALADFAWGSAYLNHRDPRLFDAIAAATAPRVHEMQPHALARLAWAFASADHPAPTLFGPAFVAACDASARAVTAAAPPSEPPSAIPSELPSGVLSEEAHCQWHAWQLWVCEGSSASAHPLALSADLSARCRDAFEAAEAAAAAALPSTVQHELASALNSLPGCQVLAEGVVTASGYQLTHTVRWDVPNVPVAEIAVEIARPSDHAGVQPTGATRLRLRQLRRLDGWLVLSVPPWEWEALGGDTERQRSFLEKQLTTVALDGRDPYAHLVTPLYQLRLDI